MHGMMSLEIRRRSALPEVVIKLSTQEHNSTKILISFFANIILTEIERRNGMFEPIKNEKNDIPTGVKAAIGGTVLFPTEKELELFQKRMKRIGCF